MNLSALPSGLLPELQIDSSICRLSQAFAVTDWPHLDLPYGATPDGQVPIVRRRRGSGSREAVLARWGVVSSRAKHLQSGKLLISTPADKITAGAAWLDAFNRRRCLVPADRLSLWAGREDTRLPWLIRRRDGAPMGLAGLWEIHHNGHALVESCVLLTTGPNEATAPFSIKLPVILDPANFERWLDLESPDGDRLLRPCPAEWIEACPTGS